MTQQELEAAVAETTGETLCTVRSQGFSLFVPGVWSEEEMAWLCNCGAESEPCPALY
jgi:hypothetical protein